MKNETKNRREKERLKENLDDILENLSKELTEDNLSLFLLGLAKYIMLGFSELGVDYSKMYQTLIKVPRSIEIIRDIYLGVDNPYEIIKTYKLNTEDFYNFLREMAELGLISYDRRRIKMTEKGRRLYKILEDLVNGPVRDLLRIFDNYYSKRYSKKEDTRIFDNYYSKEEDYSSKEEDKESIWLDLSDPAVRQVYEYLKKKFEEEGKSS